MIKFIRAYRIGEQVHFDVVHESRKCFLYSEENLPNTAISFIDKAVMNGKYTADYDNIYKRDEIIYG